jgi:peptidoglycan/xylan/chitin deacetylase (PgdA/CDA1 family)/glycosyltransferase involved in cell wall biosynthesis
MNILHVFSANLFTGSVDHALELAAWQQANGHTVLLASDFLLAPRGLPHVTVPVHNRKYLQRMRNAKALRNLVKEHGIHVVHAHSRAASATAYRGLKGLKTALVSTIHGRQHIHFKSKNFDPYGEKIICVSETLREHLISELRKDERKTVVIPNGLRFPEEHIEGPVNLMSVALIGRLSGPKGAQAAVLMEHVFPQLLERHPSLTISIVGGSDGPIPKGGDAALAALKHQFGERITAPGFVEDIGPSIQDAGLVIGAGRVALRALHAGRPVAALGEAAYSGIVSLKNVERLAVGNFGDTGETEELEPEAVLQELDAFFGEMYYRKAVEEDAPGLAEWVDQNYNLERVAPQIMRIYTEARMRRLQPDWMPVLMYHKVPDAEINTPHRIFVTRERFAQHLRWMAKRGLTPVTFSDYEAVAWGERMDIQWPKKPVVLTFDDGYTSVHRNALPLMQERGWRGVLYLLGDGAADRNFWDAAESEDPESQLMGEEQARDMVRAGWDLGAHTMTHPHLDKMPPDEAKREIRESRLQLEERYGVPVKTFAYPYGSYNDDVVRAVWEAGYDMAVATDTGGLRLEDDRYRIFRVNMFPEEGWFSLRKKTSGWYRRYYFRKRGK